MKKREKPKSKDNVIFLPGLEKRLTEKGLESLQKKNYSEAIQLLEEGRILEPDNGEILMGLVLAYFESGHYQHAKDLASEMLLKGIGEYFQMVDLYLTILIQLHEYQEIVITIEALLEEKEIPPEKYDHFLTILQFSRRMADHAQPEEEHFEEQHVKALDLSSLKTLNEQMLAITSLADKNIRPYLDEMAAFLRSEQGHPFLKTLLLTLLKEQEYDRELLVTKFFMEQKVIPTDLPDVHLQGKMNEIKNMLQERLEHSNPVLFENIISLIDRIFFIIYPFELVPENPEAWAAAFHFLGHFYFGMDLEIDTIAADFHTSSEKIEQAISKIREIEEISYPNI